MAAITDQIGAAIGRIDAALAREKMLYDERVAALGKQKIALLAAQRTITPEIEDVVMTLQNVGLWAK